MRVVITQPNYFPWRGWFAQVHSADLLILYDTVQYTRRDWRNRNRIRSPSGQATWLTVPVKVAGKFHQTISDTKIVDSTWCERHLRKIRHVYSDLQAFSDIAADLDTCLRSLENSDFLLDVTQSTTEWVLDLLGVKTPVILASSLPHEGKPSERLAQLVAVSGGTTYLTGPAAFSYLDETSFVEADIDIEVFDYALLDHDPEGQLPDGEYSVIDALARLGPERVRELISPAHSWTRGI